MGGICRRIGAPRLRLLVRARAAIVILTPCVAALNTCNGTVTLTTWKWFIMWDEGDTYNVNLDVGGDCTWRIVAGDGNHVYVTVFITELVDGDYVVASGGYSDSRTTSIIDRLASKDDIYVRLVSPIGSPGTRRFTIMYSTGPPGYDEFWGGSLGVGVSETPTTFDRYNTHGQGYWIGWDMDWIVCAPDGYYARVELVDYDLRWVNYDYLNFATFDLSGAAPAGSLPICGYCVHIHFHSANEWSNGQYMGRGFRLRLQSFPGEPRNTWEDINAGTSCPPIPPPSPPPALPPPPPPTPTGNVCAGTVDLYASSTTVTVTDYYTPSVYSATSACALVFHPVTANSQVGIQFLHLNLDSATDNIQVEMWPPQTGNCESNVGNQRYYINIPLTIHFKAAGTAPGIMFKYWDACGTNTLSATETPQQVDNYDPNGYGYGTGWECDWHILPTSPANYQTKLEISFMNIDRHDSLMVTVDGTTTTHSVTTGFLNPSLVFAGFDVKVHFHSDTDSSVTFGGQGFIFAYSTVPPPPSPPPSQPGTTGTSATSPGSTTAAADPSATTTNDASTTVIAPGTTTAASATTTASDPSSTTTGANPSTTTGDGSTSTSTMSDSSSTTTPSEPSSTTTASNPASTTDPGSTTTLSDPSSTTTVEASTTNAPDPTTTTTTSADPSSTSASANPSTTTTANDPSSTTARMDPGSTTTGVDRSSTTTDAGISTTDADPSTTSTTTADSSPTTNADASTTTNADTSSTTGADGSSTTTGGGPGSTTNADASSTTTNSDASTTTNDPIGSTTTDSSTTTTPQAASSTTTSSDSSFTTTSADPSSTTTSADASSTTSGDQAATTTGDPSTTTAADPSSTSTATDPSSITTSASPSTTDPTTVATTGLASSTTAQEGSTTAPDVGSITTTSTTSGSPSTTKADPSTTIPTTSATSTSGTPQSSSTTTQAPSPAGTTAGTGANANLQSDALAAGDSGGASSLTAAQKGGITGGVLGVVVLIVVGAIAVVSLARRREAKRLSSAGNSAPHGSTTTTSSSSAQSGSGLESGNDNNDSSGYDESSAHETTSNATSGRASSRGPRTAHTSARLDQSTSSLSGSQAHAAQLAPDDGVALDGSTSSVTTASQSAASSAGLRYRASGATMGSQSIASLGSRAHAQPTSGSLSRSQSAAADQPS